MSKHVDMVVARTECGDRRLFEAPNWSNLRKGDRIKVDTQCGVIDATVVAVANAEVFDGWNYNFIITACGATKPLKKVISKIVETTFEYSEEEAEDGRDE